MSVLTSPTRNLGEERVAASTTTVLEQCLASKEDASFSKVVFKTLPAVTKSNRTWVKDFRYLCLRHASAYTELQADLVASRFLQLLLVIQFGMYSMHHDFLQYLLMQ